MGRKGFTLIELVIVIVILGILAAIALPKYVDLVTDAKMAATKAGLGAIRSVIALKYSQRIANESSVTLPYSITITTSDFFDNSFPVNKLVGPNATFVSMTSATIAGTAIQAADSTIGWWAVTSASATAGSVDTNLLKAGAYTDSATHNTATW